MRNQVKAHPELWVQLVIENQGSLDDAEPREKGGRNQ